MNRYIRQEVLGQIGKKGQDKIKRSKVAVIGLGAIGSVSAELLARSGVGDILLADGDVVDLINLQRQFIYDEKDVGKRKSIMMRSKLASVNSDIKTNIVNDFVDEKNIDALKDYDLILDCTDNMRARHVINDFSEKHGIPWIYAAAVGVDANVLFVDNPARFRKYFRQSDSLDECSRIGIVNSASAIAASLQVTEAIKFLVGKKPCTELIRFNVWDNEYKKIRFGKK